MLIHGKGIKKCYAYGSNNTNDQGSVFMSAQTTQQKQAAFWLDYSQHLSTAIRYAEALKAAEHAVQLDATNAEAWYAKGTCLAMLAQYEEALADFEQAVSLDASYAPAWDGKAWVLGILGQKTLALAAVNRALELDRDYFEAQKRKKRLEFL
jgi:tetratricopeptide (TPR) repeat protein